MSHLTKRRKRIFLIKLLAFFLVIFLILVYLDRQVRPTIKSMAGYNAKIIATREINDAVCLILDNKDIHYDTFVTLSKAQDGTVTAIETEVSAINRVKAEITKSVIEKLSELEQQDIRIPMGTFSGWQFLSGRGPRVKFSVIPAGYITSEVISSFSDAGINQTHHQIILKINITVGSYIPGYSTSVSVPATFVLAETVIVGKIPENYTQIISSDKEVVEELKNRIQ